MNKTVFAMLLGSALAFHLAACSTAATTAVLPRPAEEAASCGATAPDAGGTPRQRDCGRNAASAPAIR